MTAHASVSRDETATRLRWLARWGVLTAVSVVGLFVTFFAAVGAASSQPSPGNEYQELMLAAYAPALYRGAMVFDALGWLTMGGLIVLASLVLADAEPLRSRLAAALGVTAVVGVVGAFIRLNATGTLGREFLLSTGPNVDTLLVSFRTVDLITGAQFAAGQLTAGLGFLLVGSAALATSWVPRHVGWLLLLPGVTSLTLLVVEVAMNAFLFPVLLLHVTLLAFAGIAVARQWWRAGETATSDLSAGASSSAALE